MRKSFVIDLPAARELEINGAVYEICLTDLEVIALAMSLEEKIALLAEAGKRDGTRRQTSVSQRQVIETLEDMMKVIDRILGEGATERILGGRRANVNYMLEKVITPILHAVLQESLGEYEKRIERQYV